MGLAKDDCGELMDRTVASTVIVPRPGLEVKGAAGRDSSEASEFRVFGIAVNSYATSRIERLSNHNIEKLTTCILYIICIN